MAKFEFAHEHVDAIQNGEKTATIRVEDEKRCRPGARAECYDPGGDLIAEAKVGEIAEMIAHDAAHFDIPGHRDYRDTGKLLSQLRSYYPEREIHAKTMVRIYFLRDVKPVHRGRGAWEAGRDERREF